MVVGPRHGKKRPTAVRGCVGALSNVSVQPDEADHSSTKGEHRPAFAANEQADHDRGRANTHQCDVGTSAHAGVIRPRGIGDICRHGPGDTGGSDARTERGRWVDGDDRSGRRDGRHLSGGATAIISRTLLC